jgi:hypothetical protein
MKNAGVLCAPLLATVVALACQGTANGGTGRRGARNMAALGAPAVAVTGGGSSVRSFWECPPDSLCGQEWGGTCRSTTWWFYSDLDFCHPAPTTCKRVRCENFPPPGVPPLSEPIGRVTWIGLYVDDVSSGCFQAEHLFRIQFYEDEGGAPKDPTTPYYSEYVFATAEELGPTETFCFGCQPAPVLRFTAVLPAPVELGTGWFSIAGANVPGCYHLWGGSIEGDSKFYGWWEEGGTIPGPPVTDKCDLNYCFGLFNRGACCLDCSGECFEDVPELWCAGLGGRFSKAATCAQVSPPCGDAPGACCFDDGSCEIKTCPACEASALCHGDLNCDGTIDFRDINPIVLYLSDAAQWQAEYPGCDPRNGDLNCDGTYGQWSFGDINPFVQLMVQCGTGCPCPGPIHCAYDPPAASWAGADTVCPDACCTMLVPPGADQENEPYDCAQPDLFNGGCDFAPPNFSAIACGQTIYGESGAFDGYRDIDWYRVEVGAAQSFTVTVEAEFGVTVSAYRAGPSPSDPCNGYADVAEPVTGGKCTPVQLVTRCLPAGTYFFVMAPAAFDDVPCGADYRITLECGVCYLCHTPCVIGAYIEGTANPNPPDPGYCVFDPNDPSTDPENGGCQPSPPAFEPLPHDPLMSPDTFTFCGKVWASGGYRDLDWYGLDLPIRSQVQWWAESEVPVRATMVFNDLGGGFYGPPDCWAYYIWIDTLCDPCVQEVWGGTMYYEPGFYWFLVVPEDTDGGIFYGYPCPIGGVDLGTDYLITMTVTGLSCENEVLAKTVANIENEPVDCNNPLAYVDTYNGGCDHTPVGPVLPLSFDVGNAWRARTFAVISDPNTPLKKDYDWYSFTLAANRRFNVYLYADFPATCLYGPIEGLEVPLCLDAGVFTTHCYTAGTYWLRVYPTSVAKCGRYYYLALTEGGACMPCNFSVSGTNLDDECDDINNYDTNAGCDDPNAPPPHFMTFHCGETHWGRIYAGLISGAPYYDPDWFQITQTHTADRRVKLTVTAEFLAHVEVYLSCANYDNANPMAGLDGITPLAVGTACPNMILTSTDSFPQGTTVYGRITAVDQFGNLLTNYYPCAKAPSGAGWRWKIAVTCIV